MVQISVYAVSKTTIAEDYDNDKCEAEADGEEGEGGKEAKEENVYKVLHLGDCVMQRDSVKLVGVIDGHYRWTKDTTYLELQNGGSAILAFDTWVKKFAIGKRFSTFMHDIKNSMTSAHGSVVCRLISAEMKKALPEILNFYPRRQRIRVKNKNDNLINRRPEERFLERDLQ